MSRITRYDLENHCYHLTSATEDRRPIFQNPRWAGILVAAIHFLRSDRAFVLAYVVMPDHFHLLVVPRNNYKVSQLMQTVKGYTSRAINEARDTRGRLWQPSFHDRVIRGQRHLLDTVEYIHANLVKAGMVGRPSEYPFSSAAVDVDTDLSRYLE